MEAEHTLLRQLQNGDTAALEALITQYTPYVFAVLRRTIGPYARAEDVEELASGVFFTLWRHRKRLNTEHLRGWLGKVAANAAKDWLRAQGPGTLPFDAEIAVSEETAARMEDETERRLLAQQALSLLDDETREIFLRCYAQRQTLPEIAAAMHLKLPTVKSRLQRGRKKLKQALEASW